jgi:putative ABC transport system permease protein
LNITQGVKMALNSILANKLRSFLTMLGIIIGVSAVITLISLGQGATNQVTEQVQSLGSNLLTVNIMGRGTQTSLDYEEAMDFSEKPGIQAVAPVISGIVKAKYGNKNVDVSLEGINPDYEYVRDFHVQEGRFLLPIDIEYGQKVALLRSNTAKELFGFVNPVGEYIQINGKRLKVVGLLQEKGSSMGGSNDDKILVPISTAERVLATKGVRNVYIQVNSPDNVPKVMAEIEQKLQKKFRGDEDSYRIFNQQDMLNTMNTITTTLTMALGGIAGISLLVGGIGIMNIMLVSVTERTREIGIRKAIGAKKKDILIQFLIESVVLSGLGGVIGIIIGVGGSLLLANVLNISIAVSMGVAMTAFGFSVCIGIFFGLFPANKAAKLNPIEALRFE